MKDFSNNDFGKKILHVVGEIMNWAFPYFRGVVFSWLYKQLQFTEFAEQFPKKAQLVVLFLKKIA